MWTENSVYREDLENIINDSSIPWSLLNGKTVLVTGATGLIGAQIVNALLYYGKELMNPPKVIAFVRNVELAEQMFDKQVKEFFGVLSFVKGNIKTINPQQFDGDIHYIIHCASITSSKDFVCRPVETIDTMVFGTRNIINLAKEKNILGMLYLSSMEVYGYPGKGRVVHETEVGGFDTTVLRNSYPLSKQICEAMCCAAVQDYNCNISIARLTSTFGPGVCYSDQRVFAEFMRCVCEKRDIVLKTSGETERCYLYTADAVRAILLLLLKGKAGEAYSVANEKTYCSIYEMAVLVSKLFPERNISVYVEPDDITTYGYAQTLYMRLSTEKICRLGWEPHYELREMFTRMIKSCAEIEG